MRRIEDIQNRLAWLNEELGRLQVHLFNLSFVGPPTNPESNRLCYGGRLNNARADLVRVVRQLTDIHTALGDDTVKLYGGMCAEPGARKRTMKKIRKDDDD